METAREIPAMRTMEKRSRGDDKQQKKWRRERLWKSRGVEKSKNDFPTPLGNPANPAGFPLSHSLGDYGRFTKIRTFHLLRIRGHFFYEKVIKVKADVAALLMFDLRDISTEKFALGSLRSDDWQLGRPIASPFLSVFP